MREVDIEELAATAQDLQGQGGGLSRSLGPALGCLGKHPERKSLASARGFWPHPLREAEELMRDQGEYPNMQRTAAALETFDRQKRRVDSLLGRPKVSEKTSSEAMLREQQLAAEVGKAYGLDTAEFNSFEDCARLVRPGKEGSFVRRMVEGWKLQEAGENS